MNVRSSVGEGAGDCGGAAGHVQPGVDVFQVLADGALGYAQPAGDLRVGVPDGDQASRSQCRGVSWGTGWRRRSASR